MTLLVPLALLQCTDNAEPKIIGTGVPNSGSLNAETNWFAADYNIYLDFVTCGYYYDTKTNPAVAKWGSDG